MDIKKLSSLIEQSQRGSRKAAEQLLCYAYTPVFYQCRRFLNDFQLAENMTARILKTMVSQIDILEDADHFHKWIGNITAARCMRLREKNDIKEYTVQTQDMEFPSNTLSLQETAQVVQILADVLAEENRVCLILASCSRLSIKNIAQLTGYSEEMVAGYIADAEQGIQEQMALYKSQGVAFAEPLEVAELLRDAMSRETYPQEAAQMAAQVLSAFPEEHFLPAKRPDNRVKVLACIAAALFVLLVIFLLTGG